MSDPNAYLPASLNHANTDEVARILRAAQSAKQPGVLEELINSGPLSPGFSDALRGRKASQEPRREEKQRSLL